MQQEPMKPNPVAAPSRSTPSARCGARRLLGTVLLLSVLALPAFAASDAGKAQSGISDGDAQFRLGRFDAAVADWTRVLDQAGTDRKRRIEALARRAEAYQALGHYNEAIADLTSAIGEARKQGDAGLLANLQGSLGSVYLASGALTEAQSRLTASLKHASATRNYPLAARTLNNLGNLRLAQSSPFEAAREFDASIDMAKSAGDERLQAIALVNRARVSVRIGEPTKADRQARHAIGILNRLPDSHQKTNGLIGAVRVMRTAAAGGPAPDRLRLLFEALREAERIASESGDDRNQSHALGELASLYEDQGRGADALILARRALFHAERLNAPEVIYLRHWQLGRLYRSAGDTGAALAAYRRSVLSLSEIRTELLASSTADGQSFRETVAPVLLELVDLLLRDSDRRRDPRVVQARLVEARTTLELFRTVELEDYFRDDCVSELQAKVKEIDKLDSGTAAIYPIFLPDRIEILLSLAGGLSRTTVPVPVKTVNREVARFAELLQDFRSQTYRMPARRLYDWLIAPIEPKLVEAGVSTLVFIPDGSLRTIPMSPLFDGERYLVEKYALAVAPGLTLLDPRPLARATLDPLLGGLTGPVRGFAALPKVDAELNDIRKLHGGRILEDQTFLTGNLRTELDAKPYSVIHIASHARFDKDPKKSFILTFDGKLDMDGLEKFIKLSRFREEPVELLTLSACTTAEGDDRSALGLSGLAIKAGARSALGSLWSIEDNSTSILMRSFYEELRQPELSKAEALRRAQVSMLQHGRYGHPFFWSAFILIGNWL